MPELVLGEVPPGTHVLVMTHDHAEDFALCDAALRCAPPRLGRADRVGGQVGPLPRRPARRRARRGPIDRIRTPIGLPGLAGKEPAAIAVAVAAELLRAFGRDRSRRRAVAGR